MKITKQPDRILNTETNTKILLFLRETGAEWNGSQIVKKKQKQPGFKPGPLCYVVAYPAQLHSSA